MCSSDLFHPVSVEELLELRADLPAGRASIAVEPTTFALAAHRRFLADEAAAIDSFRGGRDAAFAAERSRWISAGLDVAATVVPAGIALAGEASVPDGQVAVRSPLAGIVSRTIPKGTDVEPGDPVVWIEAMKTETVLCADVGGVVSEVRVEAGQVVPSGLVVAVIAP